MAYPLILQIGWWWLEAEWLHSYVLNDSLSCLHFQVLNNSLLITLLGPENSLGLSRSYVLNGSLFWLNYLFQNDSPSGYPPKLQMAPFAGWTP